MGENPKCGSREKDKEAMIRWNRTVNVIRRAVGMEPFPEGDEEVKTMVHKEAGE